MSTEDGPAHSPSTLLTEAASFFYLVGGAGSAHLVIVGGMVPPLLVPERAALHLGSSDLDLCMSVAFTEGHTRQYYKSLQERIAPYFRPAGSSGFRWVKRDGVGGVPLVIDFLSHEDEFARQQPDGTRPLESSVAEVNAGPELRPFPIRSGALIERDAVERVVEGVPLVYSEKLGMRADVRIRHAGPVGFLAAKADALAGRDDSKDGYDVSWWCVHAAETADEVAKLVMTRDAYRADLFQESVAELLTAYRDRDYPGPTGYATELHDGLGAGDEEYETARNEAFAATAPVLELLRMGLFGTT